MDSEAQKSSSGSNLNQGGPGSVASENQITNGVSDSAGGILALENGHSNSAATSATTAKPSSTKQLVQGQNHNATANPENQNQISTTIPVT